MRHTTKCGFLLLVLVTLASGYAEATTVTPAALEACLQFQEESRDLDEESAAILENFVLFAISGKYLAPAVQELSIVVNGLSKETENRIGAHKARELLSQRQNSLTELMQLRANNKPLRVSSEFYTSRNDELMLDLSAPSNSQKTCDAKMWGYFDGSDKFCPSPFACNLTCTANTCK